MEESIHEWSLADISNVFQQLAGDDYHFVIPIGFPAAGKTMLLSSLFWYSKNAGNNQFKADRISYSYFQDGAVVYDMMESNFSGNRWERPNPKGFFSLIGLQFNPVKSEKFPKAKFAFVDFAGEDIQTIKVNNGGVASSKMSAVLHGLQAVPNASVTFLLLTPFMVGSFQKQNQEDGLMRDFLEYLKHQHPSVHTKADKFVLITQWDQNADPNLTPQEYIEKSRPATYQSVNNTNIVWGAYTIGTVITEEKMDPSTNESYKESHIVTRNPEYPLRLWKALYERTTGADLDHKTFWEKLFS